MIFSHLKAAVSIWTNQNTKACLFSYDSLWHTLGISLKDSQQAHLNSIFRNVFAHQLSNQDRFEIVGIDSTFSPLYLVFQGEVREVLRELVRENDGRERVQTRVLVDEKLDMAEYLLDSDLIAFGAAVESGQLTALV